MSKAEIIHEIQKLAAEHGGKPPGQLKFQSATGISRSAWYPNYWLRWGDALVEAGFKANQLDTAYDLDFLVQKYIEFIRELGRWPVDGELTQKRKSDSSFPSRNSFSRLGGKHKRIDAILEFCKSKDEYNDVVSICLEELPKTKKPSQSLDSNNNVETGFVYLIQHGARDEYKIGKTTNPIRREGEIRLELPEKVTPIHYIETDDPSGIENYWHKRFANKRKQGEWFKLSANDVKAFKRWKKIY